jgi:hypothetical protein
MSFHSKDAACPSISWVIPSRSGDRAVTYSNMWTVVLPILASVRYSTLAPNCFSNLLSLHLSDLSATHLIDFVLPDLARTLVILSLIKWRWNQLNPILCLHLSLNNSFASTLNISDLPGACNFEAHSSSAETYCYQLRVGPVRLRVSCVGTIALITKPVRLKV